MSTIITGEAKKSFKAIVVKELPEKGILNNLYFVLNGDEGDNKYDEYIWIKDPDTQQYMWEKVGYSYVDLTPYYTKTEIDGKLSPINNNLLKLNTETTFHPVININQIKPGGGQGTNKDRWTIDQAVLAAWEWINADLTNRRDYLSPGISIMFRATNLRDVNGFDGAWLIHNYSDVDFSESAFTNSDKWCRVLTEADFKFEAADETYSGFLLNTDYIKFNNAVKSITAHSTNYNNPHQVTKDQVGLGNVDNTSDLDKPLSNNDKQALNLKIGSISIGSNASGGLKLGLWGAKADGIVVGGQPINKVDLGIVVIPNVTRDQDGLFPAAKLGSLDSMQQQIISSQNTIGQLNTRCSSLESTVSSISGQLNSRIETAGVQYNEDSIVLGTANGQAIEIKEATSTTAGVLGTNLYQILDRANKLPYVDSIRIGEYSPDYITLALLDNGSYPFSQVTIPCADLTSAGVMSASNYQKLQLLELTEPLADSDITALFS